MKFEPSAWICVADLRRARRAPSAVDDDDGHHADQDAEHGQRRAQHVAQDRAERRGDAVRRAHRITPPAEHSIGSSLAARRAGKNPKTTPIARARRHRDDASAEPGRRAACSRSVPESACVPTPRIIPSDPAADAQARSPRSGTASRMSRSRAPIDMRMPISRVRSVDAHQHDVHHADPADDEADCRDAEEQERQSTPRSCPCISRMLGLRLDLEVVGSRRRRCGGAGAGSR